MDVIEFASKRHRLDGDECARGGGGAINSAHGLSEDKFMPSLPTPRQAQLKLVP
jgi:hypothetical protein